MITEQQRAENRRLCEQYPFLIPRNVFSGKRIDCNEPGFWPGDPDEIPSWDYDFTALDDMPAGWRKAFGEQMCQEIKEAILSEQDGERLLNEYFLVQIKEKYGRLCWYDSWTTAKVFAIVTKYVSLSEKTCIYCGAPATKMSTGWISPYCDECAAKDTTENYVPIV